MNKKKVKEMMTTPAITCDSATSIIEAIKIMKKKNIGFIPITKNNLLIGVITDRDILMRMENSESLYEPIEKITITSEIHFVNPETSLVDAAKIMSKNKIRRLVVLNDGKVIGVLTSKNICKEKDLLPYIIETYTEILTLPEYLMYTNSNPHDSVKTSDYPL